MPALSLTRFFSLNLSILLLAVMACLSYTAFTLYDWGIEDSLTYLMAAEGDKWQEQHSLIEVDDSALFQVYNQWQQLPDEYQTTFKESELEADMLAAVQQGERWLYVLPLYSQQHKQLLYVTHTYYEQYADYIPGPEISDWVLLFSAVILLLALLVLLRLVQPLSRNIKGLATWSKQQAGEKADMNQAQFAFVELQQVAESVHYLATSLQQKNQQESLLLRALSHELRNPLAITQAALDRIEQQKLELPETLDKVLAKIGRANQTMCQLSESILWLWADNGLPQELELVELESILQQELQNQQYLLQGKQLQLQRKTQAYQLRANPDLLLILLRNLVRNAFQYASHGQLTIQLQCGVLSISNPMATTPPIRDNNSDYGYGVGLLLVQKICHKCGWQWQVSNEGGCFNARVVFEHRAPE